ncbi:MAG TPA: hypothetical protein VM370_01350 [Candidatus Thermoplasmatota archaeon]|nr:hypothetical protein [Candidatus Thermoplasmatota archaeon]
MRALLVAALLLTLTAPAASAAPGKCLGQPADGGAVALTCERHADGTCFVQADNRAGAGPVAVTQVCGFDLCREQKAGSIFEVSCESRATSHNTTQRSMSVDVQLFHSIAQVPSFRAHAEFSQARGDDGSASHCRARYDKWSGPGPESIEAGQDCPYPFFLP